MAQTHVLRFGGPRLSHVFLATCARMGALGFQPSFLHSPQDTLIERTRGPLYSDE
jgi:hypothetical protein